MRKPNHSIVEIFLQPGEIYFGDRDTRIRTVLGSCVSLTLWHPELRVGGMCHYMLPFRSMEKRKFAPGGMDGRYADEAFELLLKEVDAMGAPRQEYHVKLFGGGNMFPERRNEKSHVGLKNVEIARKLVEAHGLHCMAEHLGGHGHRNVVFDVWDGNVWVRQSAIVRDKAAEEKRMRCTEYA
jgi:chemotaxis protein CheD